MMSSWFNQNHRRHHHHHHHSNNVHIMIRLLQMYIYPHVISHMCAESWNETKRQRGRDAWGIPVTHVDIGNTLCSRGKSYRKGGKIWENLLPYMLATSCTCGYRLMSEFSEHDPFAWTSRTPLLRYQHTSWSACSSIKGWLSVAPKSSGTALY